MRWILWTFAGVVGLGVLIVLGTLVWVLSGRSDFSLGEMPEPSLRDGYCYDFSKDSCVESLIEPVYAPVWLSDREILFYFGGQERDDSGEGTGVGGLYAVATGGEGGIRRLRMPSGIDKRFADDYSPSRGRDGATVVYATFRLKTDGRHNFEIASAGLDGKGFKRLTETALQDTNPVVSPDGRHIAFLSSDEVYGEGRLFVMDLGGGNLRALAPEVVAWGTTPAWSPDSGRLAFVAREEWIGYRWQLGLYVVDLDGSNLKRLGEAWARVVWSPGGELLAFRGPDREYAESTDLYVINPAAGEARVLSREECPVFLWSPDGREVLCGRSGLTAVEVETGQVRVVRTRDETPGQEVLGMAWAPDGRTLAVRVAPMQAPDPCGGVVLFTIDRDGSGFKPQVIECEGELTAASGGPLSSLQEREGTGKGAAR